MKTNRTRLLAIRKWSLRIAASGFILLMLLLIIVLNPGLLYAKKTNYRNFRIYHNQPLHEKLFANLDSAEALIKRSECYNASLQLDICLNDGSYYPGLIQKIRGQAFAFGFYNKVVLQGNAQFNPDRMELNGYNWNLPELLAHEMVHCLQYDKFGFWHSKPIAKVPDWKWEGYAEYISRPTCDESGLVQRLDQLANTPADRWGIVLSDSTIAPRLYFDAQVLVQYCMDVKKMSFAQLISDTSPEEQIRKELSDWRKSK